MKKLLDYFCLSLIFSSPLYGLEEFLKAEEKLKYKWIHKKGNPIELMKNGFYQEAIWSYKKVHESEKSKQLTKLVKQILQDSIAILVNPHLKQKALPGETEVYLAQLANGIKGYFKPKTQDWKSNYQYEYIAYLLDEEWDFGFVPITIIRTIDGRIGSLQIHVHYTSIEKLPNKDNYSYRPDAMTVLDYLLNNTDRNLNNFGLVDKDKTFLEQDYFVGIDHSMSFSTDSKKKGPVKAPTLEMAKKSLAKLPNQQLKLSDATRVELKKNLGQRIFSLFLDRLYLTATPQ